MPFDLKGLVAAEGGNAAWVKYLDGLTSSVTKMGPVQIQMGDEISFDIPWEYDYAGAPYKTQQVVREIQDQLYTNTPGGLPGNDDLGATSSWYVWSALGAYPETPGSATLALGSPLFPAIAIHMGNGKTITEDAPSAADDTPYVQSLSINGVRHNQADIPAALLTKGGTLDWALGATPSTSWAAAPGDAPPSDTQGLPPALGYLEDTGVGGTDTTVISPGASSTLTLGVQNMSGATTEVSWSASAPSSSGLQVGPSSGTVVVGSNARATQAVQVQASSSAPAGNYLVTFQLRTATGTQLPDVVRQITVK